MKINYFSDIHLEFGPLSPPHTDADIIVAAGDIGVYDQGLEWLKQLDKPVVYIAGNHEHYTNEYHKTLAMLKKNCANSNVHFLENGCFEYQGVRFLGCTLWTDLLSDELMTSSVFAHSLNDFRRVLFEGGAFTPEQYVALHEHSLAWLELQLVKPYAGKTVVVTHHAPTPLSWGEAPNSFKMQAYCNNLQYLIKEYDIVAWFHGHTHSIFDYTLTGTRVVANTRGYAGRKLVEQFDIDRTIEI